MKHQSVDEYEARFAIVLHVYSRLEKKRQLWREHCMLWLILSFIHL